MEEAILMEQFDLWLRQIEATDRLEAELRTIQERLGTAYEERIDLQCAQLITHRINNLLTAKVLHGGEAMSGGARHGKTS